MPVIELAACQVHVELSDYASEERYSALLDRAGDRLRALRARAPGAFLPVGGRAAWVGRARTTDGALARIAARTLPALARAMVRGRTTSTKTGFLLAAASEARRIYRDAFRRFAREHECWVVAGTALLPRNAHGDLADRFEPEGGRVYNTSYAFDPEGRHVGCVRKVNLVPTLEDRLGISPGSPDELRPFDTSFGPVGTLICYDGFAVPHTRGEPGFCRLASRYDALGCAVLAQPAANPWPWDEPWVFADRGETQLRREQWQSEGLFTQLRGGRFRHLRYAVVPQLIGQVLDSRFDGRSQILERDATGVKVVGEAERTEAARHAEEVVLRAVSTTSAGPSTLSPACAGS
jgi:predicted amidohydrolase